MNRALPTAALGAVLSISTPVIMWYEGWMPGTYTDVAGVPTICWGHTGPAAKPGAVLSRAECLGLLDGDQMTAINAINRCVMRPLRPWQGAALVSFTLNVGGGALCSSTLARQLNAGAPPAMWCQQLDRWVYATVAGVKVRLPGLVKRRDHERAICMGDIWGDVRAGVSHVRG